MINNSKNTCLSFSKPFCNNLQPSICFFQFLVVFLWNLEGTEICPSELITFSNFPHTSWFKSNFFAYLPSSWYCLSPLCLLGKCIMLCSMYVYTQPQIRCWKYMPHFFIFTHGEKRQFSLQVYFVSRILSCKMGQGKPVNTMWTWCYINVKLNIPYN